MHRRYWTEQEDMLVETMLQQGSSLRAIAQKAGRSYDGVRSRLRSFGLTVREQRSRIASEVRPARQVGVLMGVTTYVVVTWVRQGWLKAKRNGTRTRKMPNSYPQYLITDDALIAFLARREGWVSWEPSRITDPDWREYAAEIRARNDGYWMLLTDVACYLGHPRTTVQKWGYDGALQGVATVRRGRTTYYWSKDIEQLTHLRRRSAA